MPITRHSGPGQQSLVTLRKFACLRWYLLVGEAAAILLVPAWLDILLPHWPMLAVVALQAIANGATHRRAVREDGSDGGPDSVFDDDRFFVQLIVDIVSLSVLMFLAGGAANPLISLLLPPAAVAALTLATYRAAVVCGLAVAAYSLLNFVYLPLPVADAERAARLHLAGMWFTFVLSVVLLAWFIVRLKAGIRQRDADLAGARERALRDERVVALGALAAGAAHELSTPLATMAVIAGEIEHDPGLGEEARADLALLNRQIAACKTIISRLADQAGAGRLDAAAALPADRWLSEVHRRWLSLRVGGRGVLRFDGRSPAPTIIADTALEHGLINLLNNGADASVAASGEATVDVVAGWDERWLQVEVRDQGAGFPRHVLDNAGRVPMSGHGGGHGGGHGIGLFLARAAVSRLGGELSLHNMDEAGGGMARIRLPLRTQIRTPLRTPG
jgi:two-component system sensor histidine kinase RegB